MKKHLYLTFILSTLLSFPLLAAKDVYGWCSTYTHEFLVAATKGGTTTPTVANACPWLCKDWICGVSVYKGSWSKEKNAQPIYKTDTIDVFDKHMKNKDGTRGVWYEGVQNYKSGYVEELSKGEYTLHCYCLGEDPPPIPIPPLTH